MNSALIEDIGISHLKIFLSQAKNILPSINNMEKYPIWDGELLLYRNENKTNENLICRVPIQVKSRNVDKIDNDIVSYNVEKTHLEKYASEGGVLFTNVLYNDSGESRVYMNLLLKPDIFEILNQSSSKAKTTSIKIPLVKNYQEVVTYCKNFNIHSKLQAQIPQNLDLSSVNDKYEIVSYSHINDITDLVTKDQYAYAKLDCNMYAYVGKYRNKRLANIISVKVGTENRKYYNGIVEIITESEKYFEIGKYVRIDNKKLIVSEKLQEDNIRNTVNDLEFVLDLLENKCIKIGDRSTQLKFDNDERIIEKIQITKSQILYFKSALETIEQLHLDIDRANIQQVIKDEREICSIRDIINGQKAVFDDTKYKKFVNFTDVLNQKYLVYFVKNNDGTYSGYDYFNDDIVLNNLIVDDSVKIQLSRYYNLKSEVLVDLNIDEDKIIKELKKVTINENTITYFTVLLLEFIKAYDLSKDIKFLNIAEKMNKLIMNEPLYNYDYYRINKFQMLKRKSGLSNQDKKEITKIKINNQQDLFVVCSCCLLCDYYDDFEEYFNQMDKDHQEIYKLWSIYYFYEEYLNQLGKES